MESSKEKTEESSGNNQDDEMEILKLNEYIKEIKKE